MKIGNDFFPLAAVLKDFILGGGHIMQYTDDVS